MSQSVFTSASPPGAGRYYDYELDVLNAVANPNNAYTQTFTSNLVAEGTGRISGQSGAAVAQVNPGFISQPGGTQPKIGLYKGRMCIRYLNDGGLIAAAVTPIVQFQAPLFDITSDMPLVWRVIATIAADAPGAQAFPLDNGLWFAHALGSGPAWSAGTAGFGVGWDVTGFPFFSARRGGVRTAYAALPTAGADTEWHSLEFQISNASKGADAAVAVLWDGVAQVKRSWGAGTILPDFSSEAGWTGLLPIVGNLTQAYTPHIYLSRFRIIAGPTLSSCF